MSRPNRYLALRPGILGLAKVSLLAIAQLPIVRAAPLHASSLFFAAENDEGEPPDDPSLWLYLSVAAFLVLLGGAFAGLTIALMGQDEMYLQVIKESGEGAEQKYATKVLALLHRGKHWVLVTLLLGNVITNETLPIVLDRSLGGGWPAVLGSTVLIVIFGEIAPQSVCVRFGLPIGSWMAPFVLGLMYLLSPVAWPTAKLLDWLLGEDHGTVYKKAGLKTLVSLHKTLGDSGQKLNQDEVTIIGAVLDLKDKSVGSIMTPMDDVYTLSLDDILDEDTMDELLSQGYSRVPIHHPDNDRNFVGMLLVKMLITYDPEDALPVRDFALATLPETRAETSCLDIINFFQEGKSHMVLVSEFPGEDHGALGVLTLEDVIEELIGEEIVDESDVFVDVHKAIRRLAPAPRTRIPKGHVVEPESTATNGTEGDLMDIHEDETLSPQEIQRPKQVEAIAKKSKAPERTTSPRQPSVLIRRRSSATDQNSEHKVQRYNTAEMREHLKHLGPSNLASRPKTTRSTTVKIKPGVPAPLNTGLNTPPRKPSQSGSIFSPGVGDGLIASAGKQASDGVQAVQQGLQGYGTIGTHNASPTKSRPTSSASKGVQVGSQNLMDDYLEDGEADANGEARGREETKSEEARGRDSRSNSTIRSLPKKENKSRSPTYSRGPARSGSITENIVDANGIRKVVLETNSSSSNEEDENSGANKGRHEDRSLDDRSDGAQLHEGGHDENEGGNANGVSKKKKRRRRKQGHGKGEQEHLLG